MDPLVLFLGIAAALPIESSCNWLLCGSRVLATVEKGRETKRRRGWERSGDGPPSW